MERLFVTLLNMSLTASWIVGAVVLFRFVFRRAPKWILRLMWGLVALRLVIPGFLESPTSLLPTTQPVEVPVVYTQPIAQYTLFENVEFSPVPEQPVTEQVQPVLTPSVPVAEQIQKEESRELEQVPQVHDTTEKSVFYWCGIVWCVGVCFMIAYCIFSYLRLYLLVREHIPVEKGVYICDRVNTPFILGLIRPKIYLPVALSAEDKVYVLAHEFAHIRRKDHWWKPIGFLLLSVYWFNPVMWLAYILLCRDIEGACDEKVIKQLGEDQKRPYSNALINCSAPAKLISACPLAFGEGKLRSRIKSVLHYKKPTLCIVLFCLIVGIVITAVFLTDPMKETESGAELLEEPQYAAVIEDFNKLVSYRLSPDFEESWNRGDSFLYSGTLSKALNTEAASHWPIMVLTMVSGLDTPTHDSFGWVLYDMNKDGVQELFFVREDVSLLAVFTIANNSPVLIDAFWDRYKGVITEKGELYTLATGGADDNTYTISSLGKIGDLSVVNSFCMNHGVLKNDYFDHNRAPIDEEQFNELLKRYPFEFPDSWYSLSITASKKVEYAIVEQPKSEKTSYEIVNNPGSDGQMLDLDYPFLIGADKDYSVINKLIEDAVYERMYGDVFKGLNLVPEYTKFDYTVTCATDDLISFIYEGTIKREESALITKLKLGFTFDLKAERRLYIRDFVPLNDAFVEYFLTACKLQMDDMIVKYLNYPKANVLNNLIQCDQDGSETSFYISQDTLCIVYPVPSRLGGDLTVRLRLDSIGIPNDAIRHFTAYGKLTDKQDVYEVNLYSQKEKGENSKIKVFLMANSNTATYYTDCYEYDFVSFDEGSLYVADFNSDGIDEILLNFVISADGDTRTYIMEMYEDRIVCGNSIEVEMHDPIIHACDIHPSLVPRGLVMEENKDEKYVLFFILGELMNYIMDSKIKYSNVTIKDMDLDGDYEIICQELTQWGDGLEQIAELTLNYDKECDIYIEKREIIVPAKELPPDYSRYDIEVEIPDDVKEFIEKKSIE